jgi:altronate dehydratase
VNAALVISARDNVATVLEPLEAGRVVTVASGSVTVVDQIPRGHKMAIRPIRSGESVVKYGSRIGIASADIRAGAHVHTHNVMSERGRGDLATEKAPATPAAYPRLAEPDLPDDQSVEAELKAR